MQQNTAMKILFLVYHGFSEHSGISKKIHYQVKGLRQNGHDVRLCYYDFSSEGHRCRYVDNQVIADYGMGAWAGLRQRMDYSCLLDYCLREGIEMIYARCFQNANPWLIRFFKKIKAMGIHSVTEIPTYPYDDEFRLFDWKSRLNLAIDRMFRRSLYGQMDALVTFSDANEIFGQRTIRISNGVDFDAIPLHSPLDPHLSPLHVIGVAEVHLWHGYDRLIAGIGEYYHQHRSQRHTLEERTPDTPHSATLSKREHPDIFFHIVGGVHPAERYKANEFHPGLQAIIDKYHIQDHVIFHGTLFGKELDDVFNQCQFAIGSLARHRSGITAIKTLKNREYATRGIPFIYSEQDSDFDHQPYIIKAPADESPIDIRMIFDFMSHFTMRPEIIRKTVEHLSWKIQMQKVVEEVQCLNQSSQPAAHG